MLVLSLAWPVLVAGAAVDREITIATPQAGAIVSSPFTLSGSGTVSPNEGNLAYLVYDSRGAVIGQGSLTVQGAPGGPFTFSELVSYSTRTDTPGRIEIVEIDEAGGPPFATTSVSVRLLASDAGRSCFAQTGYCIEGHFLDAWVRGGGLAINGLPLSGVFEQRLEDGKTYQVQYFERVRMEYHPENAPPYDVLLGQFGRRILAGVPGAPTARAQAKPGYRYFSETGHNVGPRFSAYWQANGGLAQFGFPLTELFEQRLDDGRVYEVQYFERARFEHHSQNPPPYDVLLGQFGRQILAETTQSSPAITIVIP